MNTSCYRIRAGRVTEMDIPAAGLPIFASKESLSAVRLVALAGVEHPDWSSYTLGCVAEIATRLAPWSTWYCSADATDGDDISAVDDGLTYNSRNVIWLRTSKHPDTVIPAALHEAYHLCEKWLTASEISALRTASERGPVMDRMDAFNTYWCSGKEVRARAFAAWSYSHWLMGTVPTYRRGDAKYIKLWTLIYTGGLGVRMARHIPASRLPDVLRQRLAQVTVGQKVMNATRSGLRAAGEWILDAFRPDAPAART
jgi:hypothetical protein